MELLCVLGRPVPTLTWLSGSNIEDDNWSLSREGFVRNDLVIKDLSRSDLGSKLTCQAKNNNMIPPNETSFTLDMTRK